MTDGTLWLADLNRAGLAPDWQTVYVGWRGFRSDSRAFGARWYEWQLPASEVQQFAVDCLSGDPEDDYRLVRVMDAEPSDVGLEREDATLRALAARSGVDDVVARRKWRYALALTVPLTQPPLRPDEIDDPYADAAYNWYSQVADFERDWGGVVPEFPLPTLDDFEAPPVNYIACFRRWLDDERAALNP